MARKLTRDQIETLKLLLAGEIRDQYSLGVPVSKHHVDVTVTREYRFGSHMISYIAKVDSTGWQEDTATGTTELKALRALHRKLHC